MSAFIPFSDRLSVLLPLVSNNNEEEKHIVILLSNDVGNKGDGNNDVNVLDLIIFLTSSNRNEYGVLIASIVNISKGVNNNNNIIDYSNIDNTKSVLILFLSLSLNCVNNANILIPQVLSNCINNINNNNDLVGNRDDGNNGVNVLALIIISTLSYCTDIPICIPTCKYDTIQETLFIFHCSILYWIFTIDGEWQILHRVRTLVDAINRYKSNWNRILMIESYPNRSKQQQANKPGEISQILHVM